jgi:hypothetical protein
MPSSQPAGTWQRGLGHGLRRSTFAWVQLPRPNTLQISVTTKAFCDYIFWTLLALYPYRESWGTTTVERAEAESVEDRAGSLESQEQRENQRVGRRCHVHSGSLRPGEVLA